MRRGSLTPEPGKLPPRFDPTPSEPFTAIGRKEKRAGSRGVPLAACAAAPRAICARHQASRHLAIDDTLGEAHSSLARIRFYYEWDRLVADREFQRAGGPASQRSSPLMQRADFVVNHHALRLVIVVSGRIGNLRRGDIQLRLAQFDDRSEPQIVTVLRQIER